MWDEVRKLYPELKDDTEVADEVVAMYSGRRGAERLREEMRKVMEGDGSLKERAAAVSALGRVRDALKKFWRGVADFLGIHFTTAEEVADRVMVDMLSGVDPTKVKKSERVKKQIIGERGAERLDSEEMERGERMRNLEVAKGMEKEGRDAKTVKLATGWERGVDGMWRYEVGDLRVKGNDVVKRYREVLDEKKGDGEKVVTLGELCDGGELLNAYPRLSDVKVEIGDAKGAMGYYIDGANKIVLDKNRLEWAEDCLTHEVQHVIQELEGFEGGGNSVMGERIARERNKLTEMQQKFVDDVRLYDEIMDDERSREKYPLSAFIRNNVMDGVYDKDFGKDLVGMSDEELRGEAERLMEMDGERLNGFEAYRRLAGEVEARNASERRGMSVDEKRGSLLEETEDVPREKQILQRGEQMSKNNESSTSNRTASELGQPTQEGAALATFNAKVDRNAERSKNLINILQKIEGKNGLGAHELLHEIGVALGSKAKSTDRSLYFDLGDGRTLRLANHQGDANTFARNGKKGENYGVVIKLSNSRFKSRGDVDYAEFVYYGDKIVDGERQKALVNGIERFVRTGDVDAMPMPDKLNTSGRYENLFRGGDVERAKRVEEGVKRMHMDWGKRVRDVAEGLGMGDRVMVVESADDVDGATQGMRGAKGWYDPRTGKVVVVLGRHSGVEDVMRTVLHEGVAHYGLRGLVGKERMNGLMDGVFARLDEVTRKRVADEAKRHGWDVRVATEEYLASLAEDGEFEKAKRVGVWERVKGVVGDVLAIP